MRDCSSSDFYPSDSSYAGGCHVTLFYVVLLVFFPPIIFLLISGLWLSAPMLSRANKTILVLTGTNALKVKNLSPSMAQFRVSIVIHKLIEREMWGTR